ncbi:hypothetical protein, partial [Algiphilus sp.]|uniref:hypothetical protein n=1 Tax=Algiphilus sp. TaxID=1872431 RepID=UPI0032ECD0FA
GLWRISRRPSFARFRNPLSPLLAISGSRYRYFLAPDQWVADCSGPTRYWAVRDAEVEICIAKNEPIPLPSMGRDFEPFIGKQDLSLCPQTQVGLAGLLLLRIQAPLHVSVHAPVVGEIKTI